jgi:ribbon-helix-helix CopG family protein
MPSSRQRPTKNGKTSSTEAHTVATVSEKTVDRSQKNPLLTISIDAQTADKVRDLAVKERISDSAIVEVALRQFFRSGVPNLLGVLERLGIPRHRRQQ